MRLKKQRQHMKAGLVYLILPLMAALALFTVAYRYGLSIGPEKSLLAMFVCLAAASMLGIVLLIHKGRS